VPGRGGQALRRPQDAGGPQDQAEPPLEPQVLDPGQQQVRLRQPAAQVVEHGRVRVDADHLDPGPGQRHGQAAGTDAQVEHRAAGGAAPPQPGLPVGGVGEGGVQLGKTGVGVLRIVADDAPHARSVHSP